jgi:SP family general alpha glucoside:H+ symporter-like MFS transporter
LVIRTLPDPVCFADHLYQGYDAILIGNFFAYPAFAEKYGQYVDERGQHQLSAAWQATLGNASTVGCFFGTIINGYLVDRFGQKRVIIGSLAGTFS